MMELAGKTGIITSGSSRLGFAATNALAEAGAVVYAVSRSSRLKLEGETSHENVVHLAADVSDHKEMGELTERIGREHGIDFLVNNAGITVKNLARGVSDADFEKVLQVNVSSVFKLYTLCYPYLKQSPNRGRIVNITSMAAHLGFSEVVPYCTSEGAVLPMTRGLAVEQAQDGINVNSVVSEQFLSEMSRKVMDGERKQKILAKIPVHYFDNPRDIGTMAEFLVSDESEYITGQDFATDGGALSFGYQQRRQCHEIVE